MREFLGGPTMVPYEEPWMDRVDAMKSIQGWSDVSITHFNELAVHGEQIVLWCDTEGGMIHAASVRTRPTGRISGVTRFSVTSTPTARFPGSTSRRRSWARSMSPCRRSSLAKRLRSISTDLVSTGRDLDFTSSLYLGMYHPTPRLPSWSSLTTGVPRGTAGAAGGSGDRYGSGAAAGCRIWNGRTLGVACAHGRDGRAAAPR